MNLSLEFWLKEWSYSSIFGYFHEFESREELTYLFIFGYFHEFETRKE